MTTFEEIVEILEESTLDYKEHAINDRLHFMDHGYPYDINLIHSCDDFSVYEFTIEEPIYQYWYIKFEKINPSLENTFCGEMTEVKPRTISKTIWE